MTNHSWHVTLYVTARGSARADANRALFRRFRFHRSRLAIQLRDDRRVVPRIGTGRPSFSEENYRARSKISRGVHREVISAPMSSGSRQNQHHAERNRSRNSLQRKRGGRGHGPEHANQFWRVLLQSDSSSKIFARVLQVQPGPFSSAGSCGDAILRPARALHPGGVPHLPGAVTREAYSHEVSSLGFWPATRRCPTRSLFLCLRSRPIFRSGGAGVDEINHSSGLFCPTSKCGKRIRGRSAPPVRRSTYDAARRMGTGTARR